MLESQINAALGRALAASPRARELCRALAGRSLRLDISATPLTFLVSASEDALRVTRLRSGDTTTADVTIAGAPVSLLAALAGDPQQQVARGGLTLGGDDALASQFQALAALLRPDIETVLALGMGRISAHLVAGGLQSLHTWGRATAAAALRTSADYLAHESRDLVPRAEAEDFLGGVESLRQAVARAEARAADVATRLEQLAARRTPERT